MKVTYWNVWSAIQKPFLCFHLFQVSMCSNDFYKSKSLETVVLLWRPMTSLGVLLLWHVLENSVPLDLSNLKMSRYLLRTSRKEAFYLSCPTWNPETFKSHPLFSWKKKSRQSCCFPFSVFTCPGEQTISREVCYDLKPYDFKIHLKTPGGQPILCEAAFNSNLLCGYNTGAGFKGVRKWSDGRHQGTSRKHDFMARGTAGAGAEPEENHMRVEFSR